MAQGQGQIHPLRQRELCRCRVHIIGTGNGVKLFSLFTGPGELTQPVFNSVTNKLAGHQMDAERHSARQFGAQHVVERLHNRLIRTIDGNGFQHKAHRGVIHEQAGLLVVITIRQQTAELREVHLTEDLISLSGFIR